MRNSIVLILLFSSLSLPSFAAIFRIGYPGTAVTGVDYAYNNIAGAMTAAASGDTMQLYQQYWPGSTSVTVTKPLKFIGFGYMLDKNPGLQAIANGDNNFIYFTFNAGSSGSIVMGAFIGTSTINVSNITITRSRFYNSLNLGNTSLLSNISIGQCFFIWSSNIYESGTYGISNLHIYNCFFPYTVDLPHTSGLFNNNVIGQYPPNLYSFIVKNNVFGSTSCPAAQSNVFQNNLFTGNCSGSIYGTGNVFNINMANVFVNWSTSVSGIVADTQLVLKSTSPAIGAGLRNDSTVTDAGIYGGEAGEIYKLSGIPPIPAIYQLSAPGQAATTNPYNITISVRSNN